MWLLSLLWLAILGVTWLWGNWRFVRAYWKIGARYSALPILGHAHYLLGDRHKVLRELMSVGDHALANGGVSSVWLLHRFYIVLADTEDASYVMKKHLEKCDLMGIFRIFTRTSHLFATADVWRLHRKIKKTVMSPKTAAAVGYGPVFAEQSAVLAQQLRRRAGRGDFAMWEHCNAYALDTACRTILGMDIQSQTYPNAPLRHALNSTSELASEAVFKLLCHANILRRFLPLYKKFLEHDQLVKEYVEQALQKYKNDASSNTENKDMHDVEQQFSIVQMFANMMEQGDMDHEALYDETVGLLVAAMDTTGVTLSQIAVTLAERPDVQEKIYQELKQAFGDTKQQVTKEDLSRLNYLEAVIKETLRLNTTVPQITRKALVDMTLPSGVFVPKGTNFLVSIYAVQRNPKYWGADADQFRPERFLDGSVPEQAILFAFSHGPRACTGIQHAMMSMKTALAVVLRQYRLLPAAAGKPLRPLFGVTMNDEGGFQVQIEERNTDTLLD